jgi:hypothetical protein
MEKRPVSRGNAGSTSPSADPEVLRGALVLVAAAAGLVWALAPHDSSEVARNALESQPEAPKLSK